TRSSGSSSELVAETNARVEGRHVVMHSGAGEGAVVGRQHEAVGSATELLVPGHASIHIDVTGEAPVDRDADHVLTAGAVAERCAVGGASSLLSGSASRRATRNVGKRVVAKCARTSASSEEPEPLAVVSTSDIQGRGDRILHTNPEDVQILALEVVVVVDERQVIATREEGIRSQRAVRILVL